jgi:hypothetical protein
MPHTIEGLTMRTKLLAAAIALALAAPAGAADLTKGTPELKSITALAFGPNGLVFIGDPLGANVFAVDTGDAKPAGNKDVTVEKIDEKIAATLGVTAKEVRISDVKVNPASGNVYVAVTRGTGTGQPALVRINRGTAAVEAVNLKDVPFAQVAIPNPFEPKAKARATRADTITGMAFIDGKLFIAGLSSEEFASTLRVIPYPFKDTGKGAGIEIFHGAHGKIETHAPIKAFTPYKIDKVDHIMASYTCTPLVKIPVSELKPGAKVKGTTIAELGNGNQPIDMIAYTKDGKDFLLSSNTRHGVLKIPTTEFATAQPITAPTGVAGVKAEKVTDLADVTQLDKLDDTRMVILTGKPGALDLKTVPLP